ncbi:hypothetical protein [Roseovarius aquimarinus]|uniref:hypothetical protein n=1 Tax=Roseovarius aquimarinus TaxID=1229156 RepID=UPI00362A6DA2
MTAPQTDLETSIQLALEAATAANDSAEDAQRAVSDMAAAAERLDRFGARMRPIMLGILAGAVLSVGVGGLIYLRTLGEMRATAATQLEALTMFAGSIKDLEAQLDALGDLDARLTEIETAQIEASAALSAALEEGIAKLSDAEAGGATPQLLRSIAETAQGEAQQTRDAFAAGLSDLQLAMTKMLGERAETAAACPAPAPRASPRPAARAAAVRPARKPAPKPEPNPFKFP